MTITDEQAMWADALAMAIPIGGLTVEQRHNDLIALADRIIAADVFSISLGRPAALSSIPEASDDERPCDECGEPAWKCSPAPEIEPTEHNGGDRFTVTLNRAQWHRVDEALIAHGRNDAVRGQIAVTKIAAHPTPPEAVAALIQEAETASGFEDYADAGYTNDLLRRLAAALAAVPADTPSGTSETTDQAGESDHDRSDDSPGPGRSALRFPRRTDLHGGVPVDPWREGADDGETRGSGRVVDGSSVLGLASGVALSQVPKAPSLLTSLSRLTFPEDFAALIERARGWGWSGCSCGHRDCTGVADIEEATDAAVMLADLANRLAAALASVPADGETEYRGTQILLRNGDQWEATAWNSLEEARTSWPEGEYRAVRLYAAPIPEGSAD